jgi:putative MATE family efflux protein
MTLLTGKQRNTRDTKDRNNREVTDESVMTTNATSPVAVIAKDDEEGSSSIGELPEETSLLQAQYVPQVPTSDEKLQLEQSGQASSAPRSRQQRFLESLPGNRAHEKSGSLASPSKSLDRIVLETAIPSMINMAVVPLVNSVDTFWVGRMGIALALAGQAAANQAFFTLYFLVNYLPTITAPLVASAVASGNKEEARERVCESLFLSNLLGALGTIILVGFPRVGLSLVLPEGAPAMEYAAPYLRLRALSMIPVLMSATGFAAFRGMLDTVTPLKVSLVTNLVNLILDPIMIFLTPLGVVGAALATAVSEFVSGGIYLRLLLRRKLAKISQILRPPSFKSLMPLLKGGVSMLGRQMAINVGLVSAARRAQSLDPTGVAAAAYGIVMQLYSIGIVMHIAMQGTMAALVPSTLAKSGEEDARRVADRIFVWNSILGVILGVSHFFAAQWLAPFFSTIPAVQEAVKFPALVTSMLHVINGPVFAGEGVLLGLGSYRDLMLITAVGVSVMLAGLASPMGQTLGGVFVSLMAFSAVQAVLVTTHYLRVGPLAVKRKKGVKTA